MAEKFPEAHALTPSQEETGGFEIELGGGRRQRFGARGKVSEVSGSRGGGALFLERLLESVAQAGAWAALVDVGGGYDPAPHGQRLLWVRTPKMAVALRAVDLLLRDGNLPLVILDLQMAPQPLHRIPASTWYRFARMAEPTGTAFFLLTPTPQAGAAAAQRWKLLNQWSLQALGECRSTLALQLAPARQRGGWPMTA